MAAGIRRILPAGPRGQGALLDQARQAGRVSAVEVALGRAPVATIYRIVPLDEAATPGVASAEGGGEEDAVAGSGDRDVDAASIADVADDALRAGAAAYGAGDLAGSERAFLGALGSPSDAVRAWAGLGLGIVLEGQGRRDEAEQALLRAASADVPRPRAMALGRLGALWSSQGRLDDAEGAYRAALDSRETIAPGVRYNFANLLKRRGDLPEAAGHYREAIDAGDAEVLVPALLNLGGTLAAMGDDDGAAAAYERVVALRDPWWSPRAMLNLGNVHARAGRWQEAVDAYSKAADSGHGDVVPEALHLMGGIFLRKGDPADAEDVFLRAREASPSFDPGATAGHTLALARLGRRREAEALAAELRAAGHGESADDVLQAVELLAATRPPRAPERDDGAGAPEAAAARADPPPRPSARSMAGPGWRDDFRAWAAEPCPDGEWVYRGQSARFERVVPSLLRDPDKRFRQTQLFELNPVIAERLFADSPIFGDARLYEHLAPEGSGAGDRFVLGGASPTDPALGFREVLNALAQHYGYPTLYVDLSLHPLVGALFATHELAVDGYRVSAEPSIVYRWPATRLGPARLRIPAEDDAGIEVIDISRINPYLMRPRGQRALLAAPVRDPKPHFQPFGSPLADLELTDLRHLACCEEFPLPPGAGGALAADGASMHALFPDAVDPGYSYLALIALLSLVVHEPSASTGPAADSLRKGFEDGLRAAQSVLVQECGRLVRDAAGGVSADGPTLTDARTTLFFGADLARLAADEMAGPGLAADRERLAAMTQEEVRGEAGRRAREMQEGYADAFTEGSFSFLPPAYVVKPGDADWVAPEIERRSRIAADVSARAELIPSYALEDTDLYGALAEVLHTTPTYEAEARTQLAAQRRWLDVLGDEVGARR